MKKTIILLSCLALGALSAAAQNLNPQVQVTNDYETRMSEVRKNDLTMAVPDSVTQFRTEVDYTVFDTPYRGAYDFTPYSVRVLPKLRSFDARKLYVRAGAGYPLHPELQAVWSPVTKGLMRMSVYQDLQGYLGRYKSVDGARFDGHELDENFGVEGRWNKERFDMSWQADYRGLFTRDDLADGKFHDVNLSARLVSNEPDSTLFYYSFAVGLGYAYEDLPGAAFIREPMYSIDATLGPVIDFRYKLLIDFHLQQSSYAENVFDEVSLTYVRPRVEMEFGPAHVSGGVFMALGDHLFLRPDVRADVNLFGERLGVYAAVTGEERIRDYSSYKCSDHWFSPAYTNSLNRSFDEIKALLGVRGSLWNKFQYDLNGGWGNLSSMPVYALAASAADPARYVYQLRFSDYRHTWVELLGSWESDRLAVDGRFCWNKTDMDAAYLDLPAVCTNLRAVYNWNRRIFAGATVDAESLRYSAFRTLDGFINLSLDASYRFNRRTEAWARIGNLFGAEITRSPLHMERGPSFTLGVAFSL